MRGLSLLLTCHGTKLQARIATQHDVQRKAAVLEMRINALEKDNDEFFTLCLQDTSDGIAQAVGFQVLRQMSWREKSLNLNLVLIRARFRSSTAKMGWRQHPQDAKPSRSCSSLCSACRVA